MSFYFISVLQYYSILWHPLNHGPLESPPCGGPAHTDPQVEQKRPFFLSFFPKNPGRQWSSSTVSTIMTAVMMRRSVYLKAWLSALVLVVTLRHVSCIKKTMEEEKVQTWKLECLRRRRRLLGEHLRSLRSTDLCIVWHQLCADSELCNWPGGSCDGGASGCSFNPTHGDSFSSISPVKAASAAVIKTTCDQIRREASKQTV